MYQQQKEVKGKHQTVFEAGDNLRNKEKKKVKEFNVEFFCCLFVFWGDVWGGCLFVCFLSQSLTVMTDLGPLRLQS